MSVQPYPLAAACSDRERDARPLIGFVIHGSASLGALADVYNLGIDAAHRPLTVHDWFMHRQAGRLEVGDCVTLAGLQLIVLAGSGAQVEKAGLIFGSPVATATVKAARGRPARTKLPRRLARVAE